MTQGRQAMPSVLRLIRGTAAPGTAEDRGDRPAVAGRPALPPGVRLSDKEREVWDWLMQHVYTPGAHGTGDGMAFLLAVRAWLRWQDAESKTAQLGAYTQRDGVMREAPWSKLARDSAVEYRRALSEIGATPSGRVKSSGSAGPPDMGGGWSALGPPRRDEPA